MDEIEEKDCYKSGWKPVNRDNASNIISVYKKMEVRLNKETNRKSAESADLSVNETSVPAPAETMPRSTELDRILFDIIDRIDLLEKRVNNQDDSISSIISVVKEGNESKRSIFGAKKKPFDS